MELAEAIRQLVPLQVVLPDPKRPLHSVPHCAAEVFLVESVQGPAVVWLDAYWCRQDAPPAVCRIAYAAPSCQADTERWVDNDPRFGPRCLPYQKPVVLERLKPESPAWAEYADWRAWRSTRGRDCDRRAAWARVEQELSGIIKARHH